MTTTPAPTREAALAELSRVEAFHVRFAHTMGSDPWKARLSVASSHVNARMIVALLGRGMNVQGLEHVRGTDPTRPVMLVANHRSYFDMFVASAVVMRKVGRPGRIYFPVRSRYFYDTVPGFILNGVMAHWSMFPPFFTSPDHKQFDHYAVDLLTELLSENQPNIVGIHPEGTRNKSSDPYSQLRAKPGAGRMIHTARPQVIPVFVTGLSNGVFGTIRDGLSRPNSIRLRFGPPPDLEELLEMDPKGSTYKRISERVMEHVARLGEEDRREFAASAEGQRVPEERVSSG